jgi:hypothetical protein
MLRIGAARKTATEDTTLPHHGFMHFHVLAFSNAAHAASKAAKSKLG